jgi:hypothetical protein
MDTMLTAARRARQHLRHHRPPRGARALPLGTPGARPVRYRPHDFSSVDRATAAAPRRLPRWQRSRSEESPTRLLIRSARFQRHLSPGLVLGDAAREPQDLRSRPGLVDRASGDATASYDRGRVDPQDPGQSASLQTRVTKLLLRAWFAVSHLDGAACGSARTSSQTFAPRQA